MCHFGKTYIKNHMQRTTTRMMKQKDPNKQATVKVNMIHMMDTITPDPTFYR